ncbi:hypothetical protein AZSI13_09920 [Azospira sp. I13]|nr:hypothetical protein AZSI13_09920 [Azospira sp. I13]
MDGNAFPSFLPALPLALGPAALFGSLLLAGLLGGEIAQRLKLPRLLGWLLAGLLLGQGAAGLFPGNSLEPLLGETRLFFDVAVGLILFDLGRRLDLSWFRRDRSLLAAALLESALAFAAMAGVLCLFGFSRLEAGMAAAIGLSSAPAVVWLVARESRAEGQVTERCLALVAINTLMACLVATSLLSAAHAEYQAPWRTALLHPLYLLLGSVLLGAVAARLVLWGARLLGKGPQARLSQFVLLAAFLLAAVGLAHALKLSVFLALLVFGLACRQWDRRYVLLSVDLGGAAQLFYIVLFVLTGASLPLAAVTAAGLPALAYVAARSLGKTAGVMLTAPFSHIRWQQHGWLSLALLPMSGVAIALVHDLTSLFPQFGERLGNLVLAAVVLLELLGPLAVHTAFKRAGETRQEGAEHA